MPSKSDDRIKRITLRAGIQMTRRGDNKCDRVKHDHDVIALKTTTPDGEPGWSFRRGGKLNTEYWYVRAVDVMPEDFCDSPEYRR